MFEGFVGGEEDGAAFVTGADDLEEEIGTALIDGELSDGSQTVPVWIIFNPRARRSGYFHEPQIGPRAAGKATAWRSSSSL